MSAHETAANDESALEPLSCVSCRSRKLKCDRAKDTCRRCIKAGTSCLYPESRRKPTLNKRNVRELEERLAQVEGFLKKSGHKGDLRPMQDEQLPPSILNINHIDFMADTSDTQVPAQTMPDFQPGPFSGAFPAPDAQLMPLGMNEALPPHEMVEEMTNLYFQNSHHLIPVIHPGKYYQSFYGASAFKPPMCLQYVIWALGSHMDPKYGHYTDVFYRRARQYADADEMRGSGEYFITLQHAQTWALMSSYEAKCMKFSRAAMSSARAVRLVNMMGLDRADDPDAELPPALREPAGWFELEERRRTLWGIFTIDAHASISTGWPSLIDMDEIVTRLPASEEAFITCREEDAPFYEEAMSGADYAGFSGTILICQMFKMIVKHTHRVKSNGGHKDFTHGKYWKRHRELDNKLAKMFMLLPLKFRLPKNVKDPIAVHCNLNLHASIMCLHHAALEMADKHDLPDSVKAASMGRLRTSAEEVVTIVRLTSHQTTIFRSPLCALSLYSATTGYVYLAKKESPSGLNSIDISNLEMILQAMEAIGRVHNMTRSFLVQARQDLLVHGLQHKVQMPQIADVPLEMIGCSTLPLIVRSSITRHTEVSPILPGRLPLGDPKGTIPRSTEYLTPRRLAKPDMGGCSGLLGNYDCEPVVVIDEFGNNDDGEEHGHKRKRLARDPGQGTSPPRSQATSTGVLGARPIPDMAAQYQRMEPNLRAVGLWRAGGVDQQATNDHPWFVLPHRGASSSDSSPPHRGSGTDPQSLESDTTPGTSRLDTAYEGHRVDMTPLQDSVPTTVWPPDGTETGFMGDVSDAIVRDALSGGLEADSWDFMTGEYQIDMSGTFEDSRANARS